MKKGMFWKQMKYQKRNASEVEKSSQKQNPLLRLQDQPLKGCFSRHFSLQDLVQRIISVPIGCKVIQHNPDAITLVVDQKRIKKYTIGTHVTVEIPSELVKAYSFEHF